MMGLVRHRALFLYIIIFFASNAQAVIFESGKIFPEDPGIWNVYGGSVDASNAFVLVGANGNETQRGAAYLHDAETGNQLFKFTANDAEVDDYFGSAVAISGNTVVVGNSPDGGYPGAGDREAVYLFDATTGNQTHKLSSPDLIGIDFGGSVAISDNTVVVGAYKYDSGYNNSGAAYLFDSLTGDYTHKLIADDAASGDQFGRSVAISGNTVVIGAEGDTEIYRSGSVYLFDASTGAQTHKLLADDRWKSDYFGSAVAIDGNTLVVGAYGDDDNGSASGSAYLFNATTGEQIIKLTAPDGAAGDQFGRSVDIRGSIVIVGAWFDGDNDSRYGAAYLFDALSGQFIDKLVASDGAEDDWLGVAVTLNETGAFVGSAGDDDYDSLSGSIYAFQQFDSSSRGIPISSPLGLFFLSIVLHSFMTGWRRQLVLN